MLATAYNLFPFVHHENRLSSHFTTRRTARWAASVTTKNQIQRTASSAMRSRLCPPYEDFTFNGFGKRAFL